MLVVTNILINTSLLFVSDVMRNKYELKLKNPKWMQFKHFIKSKYGFVVSHHSLMQYTLCQK